MAHSNNMSKLLDKVERRLGLRALNLPDYLKKEKWAEVIIQDSLDSFSRFFPNKIKYEVNVKRDKHPKGDYCIIDESIIPGDIEILGVKDLSWEDFTPTSLGINNQPYGIYDFFTNSYGLEDIAMVQMRADQVSLFDNGMYVDFEYPNKIRLKTVTGANLLNSLPTFKVELLIKHSSNLNTIAPTKMEVLEDLAIVDVANFLYQELKYYDGLETVYGNIDLKMTELETQANRRQELITKFEETYVSAANDNQPLIMTV